MRRRAIRHNCKVHVGLKISHRGGMQDTWTTGEMAIKGRILDLSEKGCSLFTLEQLDVGQNLALIIEIKSGIQIRTEAVIRWTKRVEKQKGYASGVEFLQLPKDTVRQILNFLKDLDDSIGL
jgi:c-di-GMP-binding flagellar brake protein YcgR